MQFTQQQQQFDQRLLNFLYSYTLKQSRMKKQLQCANWNILHISPSENQLPVSFCTYLANTLNHLQKCIIVT